MLRFLLCCVVIALVYGGKCEKEKDILHRIEKVRKLNMKQYNKGDITGLMETLAEDFMIVNAGETAATNRTELKTSLENTRQLFPILELGTLEAKQVSCRYAYSVGTLRFIETKQSDVEPIRTLIVWRKEFGKWRLHREFSNPGP